MDSNPLLQNVEAILKQIEECNFSDMPKEAKAELKKKMQENGTMKQFEDIKKQLAAMKQPK